MNSEDAHFRLGLVIKDLIEIGDEIDKGEELDKQDLYSLADYLSEIQSWAFWNGRTDKPSD